MHAISNAGPYHGKNQFLTALGDEDFGKLLPHLAVISIKAGQTLYSHGEAARFVYFPLDTCLSIITAGSEGRSVELALAGSEGLAGISAVLGSTSYWHEAVAQIPGDSSRLPTGVFCAVMGESRPLLEQVHRYTRYFLAQISQSAACNRIHRLQQRLARWLLMTQDHAKADEFVETHEFLSHMLGSDRSEVTLATGILRTAGLIAYGRGKLKILDRRGLENMSCECYAIYASATRHLNNGKVE